MYLIVVSIQISFPKFFKVAKVIPVYKNGDKNDKNN